MQLTQITANRCLLAIISLYFYANMMYRSKYIGQQQAAGAVQLNTPGKT